MNVACLSGQSLEAIPPEEAGMNRTILQRANDLLREAVETGQTPGAVLLVVRDGQIVWSHAEGVERQGGNPVSTKTVYDQASLTKPVVTATAILQLVERGMVRLQDPVSTYLPDFHSQGDSDNGSDPIRLIHLLTHTSGMPAYPPVAELLQQAGDGSPKDIVYEWMDTVERVASAGESFKYSGPNYVTLQRIIERITGQNLSEYAREHIFTPLDMNKTGYTPPEDWKNETAPTDLLDNGELLVCRVHDPFARELMGGISGNAGLFSNAEDLAVFTAMMMNQGEWNGTRVLSPASVRSMTTLPPNRLQQFGRGLGWDLNSPYASNQGDLFGTNTYGHTGFTGTSLVIDPDLKIAVILLTNRVHPEGGGGSVVRLRSLIANIVAASVTNEP